MAQIFPTDYNKAREIAVSAIEMMRLKRFPFDRDLTSLFPDSILPEGIEQGSREHALFLFHAVSIDSMRQAEKVYEAMRALSGYLNRDFTQLTHISEHDLRKFLARFFGGNSLGNPTKTLKENADRLEKKCGSDPRCLLVGRDVMATIAAIDKFTQYGIPKAALLMKNYVRSGVWNLPNCEIPIKIDRHVLRMSLGKGVIPKPQKYAETVDWQGKLPVALAEAVEQLVRMGHYKREDFKRGNVRVVRAYKFIPTLTEVYREVTRREGISAIDLDDATWAIGAYACKINNGIHCETSCGIRCDKRFPSDNNACWFFLDVDKRRDAVNLFNVNRINSKPKVKK
jgi:hypothetical protein